MKLDPYRARLKLALAKRYRGYLSEALLYFSDFFIHPKRPETKFFILSYPRTGSNLLVSLLDSHPLIHCENEILMNRLMQPERYIHCRSSRSKAPVYGFKLQSHHLDIQHINDSGIFIHNLYESGFKIIKLSRENAFRSALSLIYAQESGKYHYSKHDKSIITPKIHVDPQKLLERIEWMELQKERITQWTADLPHLDLVYEEHLLDHQQQQATTKLILGFLGLPYQELTSNFMRMKSEDIASFVENAAEVISLIASSKYACYLNEPVG